GIESTTDSQLAPQRYGAFAHASQTEVPGAPALTKNLLIDALSVVQDPQPKLPPVIPATEGPRLGWCSGGPAEAAFSGPTDQRRGPRWNRARLAVLQSTAIYKCRTGAR